MKIRFCAALLLAALALPLLTGCQGAAIGRLDAIEETIENHLDRAEDAIERAMEPRNTQPDETRLTAAEAEAIALNHAGISENDVKYLRTEFGYDDGRPEYDIEFVGTNWEYEYEIHAVTGEILRSESEPTARQATEPSGTRPDATEAMAVQDNRLTEDEVLEIALQDAGLTADQITRLRVRLDYDDGQPEYEVEFYHDGWEYDYEIHAETGRIRSRDKDRED